MAVYDYFPMLKRPEPKFVTDSGAPVHGLMAEFESPAAVYHAAEKVRDAGYKVWDVHAPFPIHGIEQAMGQKRTLLPFIMGGGALTGVLTAIGLQYFTNAIDYFFVVQGKDPYSWEAYVPVTFELGVLFSAFAALLGMLALNGLPRFNHPLFAKDSFLDSTDASYFIVIESRDAKFDPEGSAELLRDAGATNVEVVEDA